MKTLFLSAIVALALLRFATAQTPAPVILQAANAPPAAAAAATPKAQAASDAPDLKSMLGLLQEMQTANTELLQKQQATLQALDDLQKAAEEIKSYGKRS
ncbi:MAG TPA: hypothetical protein VGG02_11370 [Chthoniobacterales bacterium]|jgi:Skp family chaperone for outer membrane proteins